MSYPGPGWPQPPYGGYAPRHNTAPAYIAAALFFLCAVFSLVVSIISWDGTTTSVEAVISVPGMAFAEDVTGNVDFGIATGISVACTFALFAILLAARLAFARWILVVLGAVVVLYYIYAVIRVLVDGGGEFIAALALSLVLWLLAEIVVLLPAVGEAMRGRR
ncbi:hypothetical protein KIPE111705_20100 [Kibdelosporangium persicum]|uniref:DUF4345 domain-containing protein n=1 Tax=Kibdelosporangium persicum TaxID=2698649 RepID=A0ABX2EXL8_9PSEU|nr:hypothetical protein [Kibdelosporangium persicum]NRN63545.1 hypothetical protein [Kibdelosporangium persicum]